MNATQEEQFSSIAPGAALMEPGPIDGGGREGATALPLIDLRAYARRDAAPALVDEHGALSFAELADRGRRVAGLLRNAGLEPSDRVALMTADPRAVITLAPAVVRAGMTLVVIDPEGAVETVGRALRTSDARAVVADAALLQTLSTELGRDLPECRWRVGEVAGKSKAGGLLARALGRTRQEPAEIFAAVAAAEPDDTTVPSPDDTIPAYVMFTSGSTSAPKGVVVSRRALAAHLQTLKRELGYGPASRLLNLLPFHHTDGLIHGPMMAAFTGTTLVRPFVFATHRLAELSDVLRDAEVTHFLTVPTILALIQRLLSDQPELFRTGHFRTLVSTAGALDVGLWDDVQRTFGIRVANLYGLTETVSGAVYCGPGDHSWRLGTLGRPIDMEMRVVDEGGAEIAAGQPGELWLRGDNVMTGYLGDDVGTAAVLDDGWFRTGDIVRTDGDGFVHFVGRKKNLIKRGGVSIYPEDVLGGFETVDGVAGAAVIGMADAVFEQIVVACIELAPGGRLREVETEARRRLSRELFPDKVLTVDKLPRGPSGKIVQDALRQEIERQLAPKSAGDATTAERVLEVIGATFNVDPATLEPADDPETVMGWDSYSHMELVISLEEAFDFKLTPRDILRMRTIGLVIEVVEGRL